MVKTFSPTIQHEIKNDIKLQVKDITMYA